MNPAALPCHWDTGNLGTHRKLSCKEVDPFQMVDNLTARETQWRATTRLALMDLENVQEFLRLSLENLGGSSRGGRSVPTTGQAAQTRV
jgi:hypothetical protein